MPKVSFRMASAYREWVFGVQTNTARKIHRSDHTEGRLTTAKRMLRTEGNGPRPTPSVQHSCGAPEGARSRKPRPVLCLGNRALNGRPTGARWRQPGGHRYLVTDGRAASWRPFSTRDRGVCAAG